jgi:hypothetical protein
MTVKITVELIARVPILEPGVDEVEYMRELFARRLSVGQSIGTGLYPLAETLGYKVSVEEYKPEAATASGEPPALCRTHNSLLSTCEYWRAVSNTCRT